MLKTFRVGDVFGDTEEFEILLDEAHCNAVNEMQVEFVLDYLDKFMESGDAMIISDKDYRLIEQLAKGETDEFSPTSH